MSLLPFFARKLSREAPGPTLPFVAFCIALNLVVGQVTAALRVPLYLDSIGTVLLALLCGPWTASFGGAFSNLLAGAFGNPTMVFFIPPMVAIGIFTASVARLGWFRKWYLVVLGGFIQGIIAAAISAPISAYLFGGVTFAGTDFLVIYFRALGNDLLNSVFYQGLSSDPVDKTITYLVAFFVVSKLPRSLLSRFPGSIHLPPSAH